MSGRNIPEKDQTVVSSEKFSIECRESSPDSHYFRSALRLVQKRKFAPSTLNQTKSTATSKLEFSLAFGYSQTCFLSLMDSYDVDFALISFSYCVGFRFTTS